MDDQEAWGTPDDDGTNSEEARLLRRAAVFTATTEWPDWTWPSESTA